jgi:hypothetical protein
MKTGKTPEDVNAENTEREDEPMRDEESDGSTTDYDPDEYENNVERKLKEQLEFVEAHSKYFQK